MVVLKTIEGLVYTVHCVNICNAGHKIGTISDLAPLTDFPFLLRANYLDNINHPLNQVANMNVVCKIIVL